MGSAARTAEDHRYDRCTDDDCPRFPCQVWKQGEAAGYQRGNAEGRAEGFAEGYAEGVARG